jgi:uncharacterized protein
MSIEIEALPVNATGAVCQNSLITVERSTRFNQRLNKSHQGITNMSEPRSKSLIRKGLYGVAAAGALLATGTLGISAYLTSRISRPRRSHRPPHYTFTPWEFQIPFEHLWIPVGDSEISAWHLPQPDQSAPCILALSGFASHKAELLGICSNLYRDGFQIVMVDFRGTGRSPGNIVTMGHNETADARAAVDWIDRSLPGVPIGVIGFSMGGSVALMLTATDERVGAVVSDSAFATQREILRHHTRRKTGLWPEPILAAADPLLKRKHGHHINDFSPAHLVEKIAPRPFLQIHPQDDQIVPFSQAMTIRERAGTGFESWYPEQAGHCGAYFADRPGYCARISRFFAGALDRNQ